MIGFNGKYLTAAAIGDQRITAMSQGDKWLIGGPDWLLAATKAAILSAFGAEGAGVIQATNAYLNGLATTDREKAQRLANCINEDPMLVCSIVETSKTRWLVGDGKAWIKTDIVLTRDAVITEAKAIYTHTGNSNNAIVGSYSAGSAYYAIASWNNNYFIAYGNLSSYTQPIIVGEVKEFRVEYLNGKGAYYIDGELISSSSLSSFTTLEQYIFARNDSGSANLISTHKIAYVRHRDAEENLVTNFIPHLHGGVAGMLDLVSLDFHPNANTEGAFTIAITDKP